ncbi:MAG: RNA chaperone Hfq [Clostridiales bacterium]|nr:RNA chaperone Hfq [Clostridiales bacterium]
MTSVSSDMQDLFLNSLRKESIPATFFLVNGFQIRGTISGFDIFTVMINADGKQQMVYKHAISTIVPTRALDLNRNA